VQSVFAEAVSEAVAWQRGAALAEHEQARLAIQRAGGDILALEEGEREKFVQAVAPLYRDARSVYGNALIACIGR
jgi:TRAP-type C4-dicarboxylate transport system substrate-binding protein